MNVFRIPPFLPPFSDANRSRHICNVQTSTHCNRRAIESLLRVLIFDTKVYLRYMLVILILMSSFTTSVLRLKSLDFISSRSIRKMKIHSENKGRTRKKRWCTNNFTQPRAPTIDPTTTYLLLEPQHHLKSAISNLAYQKRFT